MPSDLTRQFPGMRVRMVRPGYLGITISSGGPEYVMPTSEADVLAGMIIRAKHVGELNAVECIAYPLNGCAHPQFCEAGCVGRSIAAQSVCAEFMRDWNSMPPERCAWRMFGRLKAAVARMVRETANGE